ncbi:hypothetical protein [Blastopirellula marina]|uniref:VCBS repeat-containing protein n=1 Tax=Blastopirellula marina TaxID=124 RepID=A0A2S8F6R2_9BACT|nr:hypothetical protein [Blastopirellula marina]PQO27833.1 hypothetical protein C5Y98_26245 [Blastopirellula marina]PTL41568.1 hypothetical protein C5Y97_26260 [Blastopirellula marina]
MNTNTASIDPSLEVARLLTPERQSAYERLREWWFENQPDAPILSGSEIGHVEKYDVDDETIYVIFSGANGKHEGGICLVDSTGKINPIFQGNNYLTEEDRFMDVNGDGIPEIISVTTMGGKHESNPNRIVTNTTNIDIIPVNRVQKPLLRILFDKRKFRESSKWRWELDNSSNATVIRLFRISESNPIVHFEWNSQIGEFNCPNGSLSDGFIARPGQIPLDLIEDFIRPIESAE